MDNVDIDKLLREYAERKTSSEKGIFCLTEEEIGQYVDGFLEGKHRDLVEAHIETCEYCRGEVEVLQEALSHIAEISVEPAQNVKIMGLIRQALNREKESSFQIVIGIVDGLLKVIETTGEVVLGGGLKELEMVRGAPVPSGGLEGVKKRLGDYLVQVRVSKKTLEELEVRIYIKDFQTDQPVRGVDVWFQETGQVKKNAGRTDRHGRVTFREMKFGSYTFMIEKEGERIGEVALTIRDLPVEERLIDVRKTIDHGNYVIAEDLLASVLKVEPEDSEALQLLAVVKTLRDVDPEQYKAGLQIRGYQPEAAPKAIIKDFSEDIESRIESYNPMLADVVRGIGHIKNGQYDQALPVFERLTRERSGWYVGYAGVGMVLEYGRDLSELPPKDLERVISSFETAKTLNPTLHPLRDLYEVAVKAKTKKLARELEEERKKRLEILEKFILPKIARDLVSLVKRVGRIEKKVEDIDAKLTEISELKNLFIVRDADKASEEDLQQKSDGFSRQVKGIAGDLCRVYQEDYQKTQEIVSLGVGGEDNLNFMGESGRTLVFGEFLYKILKNVKAKDYAAAAAMYSKAVEHFLNDKIVWAVDRWLSCRRGDRNKIESILIKDFEEQRKSGVTLKILQNSKGQFVLAGEKSLTLHELANTFAQASGERSREKWEVYGKLFVFVHRKSELFFEKGFQNKLHMIVQKYRNGSVHSKPLERQKIEDFRDLLFQREFLRTIIEELM